MKQSFIGRTFLDQYRVIDFIASGGMSAVYRVWDHQRSAMLAMKLLHADLADDPTFVRRFQREAAVLQSLAHPNIVPFYGLHHTPELTFLLEKYIDGPSLSEILRQRGGTPMPLTETLSYVKALVAGLGYAHSKGIIHCDVKPGNVLVDSGGHIYLTDFGVARYAENPTSTSTGAVGTPAYMSPEQIRGGAVSPQTDIYSLGALIFHLLTGRRPFTGSDDTQPGRDVQLVEAVRQAHLNQPPPDPRAYNASIPPGVAQAVMRAMAKDPAQRFASISEMAQAIFSAANANWDAIPDRVRLPEPRAAGEVAGSNSRTPRSRSADHAAGPNAPRIRLPRLSLDRRALTLLGVLLLALLCAGSIFAGRNLISSAFSALANRTPSAGSQPTGSQPTDSQPTDSQPTSSAEASPTAASHQGEGELAVIIRQDGVDRIVLMDAASGESERLPTPDGTEGSWSPQWSPDGRWLAWLNQVAGRGSIYIFDTQSGEGALAQAGEGYDQVNAPAWLPGGERLSFYAYGDGASWLVIADRNGEQQDAIRLPGYRNLFVWNWTRDLIAFSNKPGDAFDVNIVSDPAGQGTVIQSEGEEYAPAWSNDGDWLAFQSDAGRGAGENEIWIARADGSDLRQVTTTPPGFWSRGPSWSPDGRSIAYVSNQSGSLRGDYGELFIVDVESGESRQVTDTGGMVYDWRVAWRPR